MVSYAFNPSTEETDASRSEFEDSLTYSELQASVGWLAGQRDPVSVSQSENNLLIW